MSPPLPGTGEKMRNHRISLQDIATLAGVTKMTVSRYIRSPKKVAKETGERIAQIMEEINYIPNLSLIHI